jgi:heat-inducible transcriptional repressor
MLSERQSQILRMLVERYVDDGHPVGSRALASRPDIDWSASTVRAELASLEEEGFLTHPHTSAGRVPTDSGYRFYVERLLAHQDQLPQPVGDELGISRMRREVDVAIRETTTTLSQITDLVALVTAPPLHTATIHRIEALRLQPKVVMVVVIA